MSSPPSLHAKLVRAMYDGAGEKANEEQKSEREKTAKSCIVDRRKSHGRSGQNPVATDNKPLRASEAAAVVVKDRGQCEVQQPKILGCVDG